MAEDNEVRDEPVSVFPSSPRVTSNPLRKISFDGVERGQSVAFPAVWADQHPKLIDDVIAKAERASKKVAVARWRADELPAGAAPEGGLIEVAVLYVNRKPKLDDEPLKRAAHAACRAIVAYFVDGKGDRMDKYASLLRPEGCISSSYLNRRMSNQSALRHAEEPAKLFHATLDHLNDGGILAVGMVQRPDGLPVNARHFHVDFERLKAYLSNIIEAPELLAKLEVYLNEKAQS